MSLEREVSRAVAEAQLLEHALHSRNRWFIEIGEERVLAVRTVVDDGVIFTACFGEHPDESSALLFEGLVPRACRPIDTPGSGGFCLTWELILRENVRA